MDIFYSPTDS